MIDCASSLLYMRLFYIYYWANLVPHFCAQLIVQVCSLPPHFQKFHEYACHCPCLVSCLIVLIFIWLFDSFLIKMHAVCHIFKLTFDVFWWRLRSGLGMHLNSHLHVKNVSPHSAKDKKKEVKDARPTPKNERHWFTLKELEEKKYSFSDSNVPNMLEDLL